MHGARTEGVPFARPGSEFTRDFECLVAWLATRTDKTTIKRMLRIDWDTVGRIIKRVCDDELDPGRLNDLYDIGIDEVSWKRQHKYLTLVVDHQRRQVVWGCEGSGATAADAFFDELDPEPPLAVPAARAGRERAARRRASRRSWCRSARARPSPPATASRARGSPPGLELEPSDLRARLRAAARRLDGHDRRLREVGPRARARRRSCASTPITWCSSPTRRWTRSAAPTGTSCARSATSTPPSASRTPAGALLKKPEKLTDEQAATLARIKAAGGEVWRAYTLKEAVRGIFEPGLTLEDVEILIDRLLSRLARSRLEPFVRLGKTIRKHRDGILAAIRLGINQGRTEALNNKVRLITRRAYGFHSAKAALALVLLTCGPITLHLPHELHALGIG